MITWTRRPWVWLLGVLNVGLVVAVAAQAGADEGHISGAALAAGALAYSLMATNLLLALRLPVLERLFGSLDRLNVVHRFVGTAIVPVVVVHMVLVPVASLVDRGRGLLDDPGPAIPLGVVGALIVLASVALAMNPRIPYHRWRRFHMAVAGGFVLLTVHFIVGSAEWMSLASPAGVLLFMFMAIGLLSIAVRLVVRRRAGLAYRITAVVPRERGWRSSWSRLVSVPWLRTGPGSSSF